VQPRTALVLLAVLLLSGAALQFAPGLVTTRKTKPPGGSLPPVSGHVQDDEACRHAQTAASPCLAGSAGCGRRRLGVVATSEPGASLANRFSSSFIEACDVVSGERLVDLADVHLFSSQDVVGQKLMALASSKPQVPSDGEEGWDKLADVRIAAVSAEYDEVKHMVTFLDRMATDGKLVGLIVHNSDDQRSQVVLRDLLDRHPHLHILAAGPNFRHRRFYGLPIGMQNSRWHASGATDASVASQCELAHRHFTACTPPMSLATNSRRTGLAKAAASAGFTSRNSTPAEGYLKMLCECRFVLSPEGNQPDSHRLWQVLYAGGVPVMEDRNFTKLLFETSPGFAAGVLPGTEAAVEMTAQLQAKMRGHGASSVVDVRQSAAWLRLSWFSNLVASIREGAAAAPTVVTVDTSSAPSCASQWSDGARKLSEANLLSAIVRLCPALGEECRWSRPGWVCGSSLGSGRFQRLGQAVSYTDEEQVDIVQEWSATQPHVTELVWLRTLAPSAGAIDLMSLRHRARAWGTRATLGMTAAHTGGGPNMFLELSFIHEPEGFDAVRRALRRLRSQSLARQPMRPDDIAWFWMERPGPGWDDAFLSTR